MTTIQSTLKQDSSSWSRLIPSILLTILLLVFTAVVLIPFIWMLLISVRTTGEILNNPYGLPDPIRWQNYWRLVVDPDIKFYQYYYNSIFVTGCALLLNTIIATMGGYGFGRNRYDFKHRRLLLGALLIALMLPPQILYIPQYLMMRDYGLLQTRWALVLLYAATSLPVSVYLISTYFSQLPSELEDAARIDGCNDFGMFWRVMLPLARPAIATVIVLNFMAFWNELLLAITMVPQSELRTLPAELMHFVGEHGSDYALAAASLVAASVPVFLLYLVTSERFIRGMTAGAVRG